jgi:hypothetical protein
VVDMLTYMPCTKCISIEEIANVVEFRESDKANYVAGSTLIVVGGMSLCPAFDLSFHPREKTRRCRLVDKMVRIMHIDTTLPSLSPGGLREFIFSSFI